MGAGKSIARLLLGGASGSLEGVSDALSKGNASDSDLYNALAKLQFQQAMQQSDPGYQANIAYKQALTRDADERSKYRETPGDTSARKLADLKASLSLREMFSKDKGLSEKDYIGLKMKEEPSWWQGVVGGDSVEDMSKEYKELYGTPEPPPVTPPIDGGVNPEVMQLAQDPRTIQLAQKYGISPEEMAQQLMNESE